MKNAQQAISAPAISPILHIASAVPPVARMSSTTATLSPEDTASSCMHNRSVPYSSAYSTHTALRGSLFFLRTGTNGSFSFSAIVGPKKNPRDSAARIFVGLVRAIFSAISPIAWA